MITQVSTSKPWNMNTLEKFGGIYPTVRYIDYESMIIDILEHIGVDYFQLQQLTYMNGLNPKLHLQITQELVQ